MDFFEAFSLLAGLYALWALATGEITAKAGWRWTTWRRAEHPLQYWGAVIGLLALTAFTFLVLPALK